MPGHKKPKLLNYIHPPQIEEIDGTAVDQWCDDVLDGTIETISYNENGLSDTEVLERTRFYIGHQYGRLALFASSTDGDTPSEDDYRFDSDDGWMKVCP